MASARAGDHSNRLIHEKSPYLLQHAHNPVDWYPWGDEALARAKKEDKPIFLSVGYSTCHWCHVMERESFERPDVADILNASFIPIKVDREERPDLDEIYMSATQILNGSGGWPNSIWLTPDGRPWYAGTYYPPEDQYGGPGFKTVLLRLAELWRTRRHEVEEQADRLAGAMRALSAPGARDQTVELSRDLIERAIESLRETFDPRDGGFGGAPKFPPHGAIRLVLEEFRRTSDDSLLEIAIRTLDAMALGGIRDHLGGGFHRYSTDAQWFLPHFEKMLYDNAQLARNYVEAYVITGREGYRQVAEDAFTWVSREMTSPEGAFFSAIDADSEGDEGRYYLWNRSEILGILGNDDGELFCRVYGIEAGGNFTDEAAGRQPGANIIYLQRPIRITAKVEGIPEPELRRCLGRARDRLLEARNVRVRPFLDDRMLSSWNGLMIGALAFAGRELRVPGYTVAAARAAGFILSQSVRDGRLLRTWRSGQARLNAYLDDYAFLADGLLDLHETTGAARWLNAAEDLVAVLDRHYRDPDGGGYFYTPRDHEDLLLRSKDPFDRAIPSGNGMAARVLIRLAGLTGEDAYRRAAEDLLRAFAPAMYAAPHAAESLISAAALYLKCFLVPVISTGPHGQPDTTAPLARRRMEPLTAELFGRTPAAPPGHTIRLAVRLVIDHGWHVNSNRPRQGDLFPTVVSLDCPAAVASADIRYPPGDTVHLGFSPEPLSVYRDTVRIEVPVRVGAHAPIGDIPLALEIRFQACNDRLCRSPETLALPLQLRIVESALPPDPEESTPESG